MLLQRLYRITNFGRIHQRAVLYQNIFRTCKEKNNMQSIRNLTVLSPLAITGICRCVIGIMKNNKEDEIQITTKELLTKADTLFDRGDYRSTYDLLAKYKDNKDVEILWRLSRVIYKMFEIASDIEARKLIYEGYDLLCIALNVQEDHYAVHKWMSAFLYEKSVLEGTKAQIKELYNIKKHMQRALELKPDDAMTFYLLGCWCFEISNLAWYQRKIATVLFGEPPTSSFEEALIYFENAEKADPNFYSRNLLMLGKTCLKLNRKENAVKYLTKTVEFPAKNDDDQNAKQEAQKILSSIKR